MLREADTVFFHDKYTNWLIKNQVGRPENKYTSNIIQTEQCVYVFWSISVYTYMWVTTMTKQAISVKENKGGRVYKRDGKKDMEGRIIIIL